MGKSPFEWEISLPGCWFPSEKYESQMGLLFPIYYYYMEKCKMFQATNQILCIHYYSISQRDSFFYLAE